ncbi:MAG: glycoside hydrolase family 15 protein [Microthrixaceae bacterium]|nr:glycoside hydrolase family 15 protein [Microthrixaceae bacterium]
MRIEDYALIGDTKSAALVAKDGSIDWLCLPRFDSAACFAALLGDRSNGRWQVAPVDPEPRVSRRYRGDTLVLETEFTTREGVARLIDLMPTNSACSDVIRVVEGVSGSVPMKMDLVVRFDYGTSVPWVRRVNGTLTMISGPDAIELASGVELRGEGLSTKASFTVGPGDRIPFVLTWHSSIEDPPPRTEPFGAIEATEEWWSDWSDSCTIRGTYADEIRSSLITLKALTYSPSGGIVAAPTTSLPEVIGGGRNWDYRFCWLRDATFTLQAMLGAGYEDEAIAWRDWLLRAAAGDPSQLQIMYGIEGERRLPEIELDWLAGYEKSSPVRVGNLAASQLQLDVYGEVLDCFYQARRAGIPPEEEAWKVETVLLEWLESNWRQPDSGLWEMRGDPRQMVHSKVMSWVAFDRAIKSLDRFERLDGPAQRWQAAREEIHREVLERGWDSKRGTFTQSYGSPELDASLLLIPMVGFLDAKDPRVLGTIAAIKDQLMVDGYVSRYQTAADASIDGLSGQEGAFLLCTFWLADALALAGENDEAREIFERLLSLRNDVGLLSEEYDPVQGRMLGNFPQAFSHVGLVSTALNLVQGSGPAMQRCDVEVPL